MEGLRRLGLIWGHWCWSRSLALKKCLYLKPVLLPSETDKGLWWSGSPLHSLSKTVQSLRTVLPNSAGPPACPSVLGPNSCLGREAEYGDSQPGWDVGQGLSRFVLKLRG